MAKLLQQKEISYGKECCIDYSKELEKVPSSNPKENKAKENRNFTVPCKMLLSSKALSGHKTFGHNDTIIMETKSTVSKISETKGFYHIYSKSLSRDNREKRNENKAKCCYFDPKSV